MKPDASSRPGRSPGVGGIGRGYSLVEVFVSLVILSVLLAIGVTGFQSSLEQARANVAGANLRSIWSAQRLYWLENRSYAPDLPTLQSANLIDPSIPTATTPYAYSVTVSSDGTTFTATATRAATAGWSGSYTIAADGTFSGSVVQGSTVIEPNFQ